MSDWYYSTDRRQPNGPVDSTTLQRLINSGQLPPQALLWREGLDRWYSPGELGEELAGTAVLEPPPVPVSLAAHTAPASPVAPPRPAPAPRRTGLILGLVGLGMLVAMVPMIGIVAAIALPAYQSYSERARTTAVLTALAPLQQQVSAYRQAHGHCPGNDSPGFAAATTYADAAAHIAQVAVVTAVNGNCGLAASLQGLHRDAEKRPVWLWLEHERSTDHWICRSTLRDQQLPARCQQ